MDSPTEHLPEPVPSAAVPPTGGAADPLLDAVLGERYRIDGLIGRGGMAAVYRADDLALGRRVAVKVFSPSTEGIDDAERRKSETALLASLTHPSLVTLYDAAKDSGTHREFLVMELVEGRDLREVLRSGPVARPDVARMLADLAEGLHVIHSRGIVHRDVKPANVLLAPAHLPTRRWNAKLADFGIARLLDESRLTATGRIIGTPGYLSPEQVRGETLSSAADIYALGLVMLEALTGVQAFPGPALESASARLVRDPEIPSTLGPDWVDLLGAMTARAAADRPTALDVALAAQTLDLATHADPGPGGDSDGPATVVQTALTHPPGTLGDTHVLPATRVGSNPQPSATDVQGSSATAASHDDDATAATRVLVRPDAPLEERTTEDRPHSSVRERWEQRPAWFVPVAAVAAVLLLLAVLIPTLLGGLASDAEPTPPATPLPSVPGELGEHLRQLEEAVTP
ncbi:serine/threonine-protein kinase [Agromyces indicus]|uniref:non-specific serine/threonine protein kinase n=1 Tax=Agromyces indicus TaxID=758919 RepID=A0ABU1FNY9_9MICO|nr:serine/threonine-protein kinase [Agromyces indicus]MDR5693037.1 serine/threonine-protein kinase [Agromyces indicus]